MFIEQIIVELTDENAVERLGPKVAKLSPGARSTRILRTKNLFLSNYHRNLVLNQMQMRILTDLGYNLRLI